MARATTTFLERAVAFLAAARGDRYPNGPWLAARFEVSVPTARRVINDLRDRFAAPLVYSDADRGWYLTDKDWTFPFDLCGREDVCALLVATALVRELGDEELLRASEALWDRVAERLGTSAARLSELARGFSVDRTDRLPPQEPLVMLLLDARARWRDVGFEYASPWGAGPPRPRRVVPLGVRCVDGGLYLAAEEDGARKVFNLAFIADARVLGRADGEPAGDPWSDSFGVWEGEGAVEVAVRIGPPGACYFARQLWYAGQRDRWEGEVLCRRMRAHPSPELLRRLLSVGPHLVGVEPPEVRRMVAEAAEDLAARL